MMRKNEKIKNRKKNKQKRNVIETKGRWRENLKRERRKRKT